MGFFESRKGEMFHHKQWCCGNQFKVDEDSGSLRDSLALQRKKRPKGLQASISLSRNKNHGLKQYQQKDKKVCPKQQRSHQPRERAAQKGRRRN